MNSFEYSGVWWLPSEPKQQITGTLRFNATDGGVLELIGSFREPTGTPEAFEAEIILGITSNGKLVTLYRNYEARMKFSIPGFATSVIHSDVIFIGHHFGKSEEIVFDSLAVSYSQLEEWTRLTGFDFTILANPEGRLDKYVVSYAMPKKVEVSISDLKVSFHFTFRDGGDRLKKVELQQTTFVKVEGSRPRRFEDYQENIFYHLQNFVSLAIGRATYPLIVIGKNSQCRDEDSKGNIVYKDILVFYAVRSGRDAQRTFDIDDLLFFYPDIAPAFELCLNNWFAKAETLKPVYDLYFATLYSPTMYLQHEFLSLTQALESYHRRVYGGEYVSRDEYRVIYEGLLMAIPDSVSDDFKESLKQKMCYHNEYALRRRLKEMLERCGEIGKKLVSKQSGFTDDVVNTRNFLTHYDKEAEEKTRRGMELYEITERLRAILEVCFLREIGVAETVITNLVTRNRRYRRIAELEKTQTEAARAPTGQ